MTEPLRCAFNQASEREALAQGAALATVTDDGQGPGEELGLAGRLVKHWLWEWTSGSPVACQLQLIKIALGQRSSRVG